MMKNIVTIAKSILIHVLTSGTLYAYGTRPSFNHKIESGKSNEKNKSAVIFVSEGGYVFNEDQLHTITKDVSSSPIKTKEIKTDKVLYVSEGTVIYNPQNVFIYKEKKNNVPSTKVVAKKASKEPADVKKSKPAQPTQSINICFPADKNQNHFILATDSRCCIPSPYNDYYKLLINENSFSLYSFIFPKDILSEFNNNTVSHSYISVFSIRPPPFLI